MTTNVIVDFPETVLEEAHRKAVLARENSYLPFGSEGLRRARDPYRKDLMLKILDRASEFLYHRNEGQKTEFVYGEATEYQLWRNAYEMLDKDKIPDDAEHRSEMQAYFWIYGSAGWISRVIYGV